MRYVFGATVPRMSLAVALMFGAAACTGGGSDTADRVPAAAPVETAPLDQPAGTQAATAQADGAPNGEAAETADAAPAPEAETADATEAPETATLAAVAPQVESFDPSVAACGPAGTVAFATDGGAGSTASGSLFDAAAAGPADGSGRISVEGGARRSFLRFNNLNRPVDQPRTNVARRTSLSLARLEGEWRVADGTPGCTCRIVLSSTNGETHPAQSTGCSASGLDRLVNWRLRGSEVVLLAADRTLLGSMSSQDGNRFTGGLSNGTRSIMWR